uniref:Uncharacterized protein n=1 Tax=Rhizophora mucronata TaxID=61149 RepID=A0A2P2PFQ2_RHIMU
MLSGSDWFHMRIHAAIHGVTGNIEGN